MPRCSQLNLFVKNYFPLADFVNLEIVMMSYFHWNLVRHFLVNRISGTSEVPITSQWSLSKHVEKILNKWLCFLISQLGASNGSQHHFAPPPPRSTTDGSTQRWIIIMSLKHKIEKNMFFSLMSVMTGSHTGGPIVHQGRAADYFAEYVNFFLR